MALTPIKRVAGIFWVKPEDWKRHVSLCVDGANLPTTYEKWRYGTEKAIDTFAKQGWEIVKVHVDLDEFAAWCKLKGLNIDSQARMGYANEIAAAQVRARDQTQH